MSYTMPSGKNEENKAYSRWIFFNLRPNEIARIIEHLQKGTFVPTMGANVYKQHNLTNFLQNEVPMSSETCLKNNNEWCSLTFRAKKSCLRLNLRVLQASWRKRGVFFWIRTLAASSLSTYGSDTDSEWKNYDRFSEHLSILWQSLKVLHFLMRFLPDCPKISCPL